MDFIEWIKKHPEYNVKIIENPTEEQKEQFKKQCEDLISELKEMIIE